MKFFLDTGNIEEIKRITRLGLVDGVTTNPSLIAKEGRLFKDVIKEIVAIVRTCKRRSNRTYSRRNA